MLIWGSFEATMMVLVSTPLAFERSRLHLPFLEHTPPTCIL